MNQQRNIEMRKNVLLPTWFYSLGSDQFHEYLEENKQIHFIMHELEKHAEPNEKVLSHSCTIIDGMALVRKIENAGLTYEEFALKLLNAVMSIGCSSSREDVLFDECYEISIKNTERAHRKSGNLEFKKNVGSQLKKQ